MKTKKPESARVQQRAAPSQPWMWYAAGLAILVVLLWAYSPAMHTGFLFDDSKQQFAMPTSSLPLVHWIGPVRPILMFSYWANVQISSEDQSSYHVFNLLIHCITGLLIFLVIRRLLEFVGAPASTRTPWAIFGAGLFLLHPLQSESVAYISGRSDALCGMFSAASFTAFLYRRSPAISWAGVASVVLLFLAAVLTKEQAVVLPLLFLFTDFWFAPQTTPSPSPDPNLQSRLRSVRANWKLYAVLALGAAAGVALFWRLILGQGTNNSAGFSLKDFTWYQYLFTEFRAIITYLFNFLLPVNLNVDWDFPISHNLMEHGAVFFLAALLGLAAIAWRFHSTFPLAAYGYVVFLILLSPTSSILPIQDPIADRRMYFPILGLILITIDLLRRLKLDPKGFAAITIAILLAFAVASHARAQVWSNSVSLWQDAILKSPNKYRPHFQLAFAYQEQGRPDLAVAEFQRTSEIKPPTLDLLLDWGLAYDALNQPDKALEKFRQAASLEPSAHAYTQIGYIYAKRSAWQQAMEAFDTAQKINPDFPPTYMYKGQVYLATNQYALAIAQFQKALALDASLAPARQGLVQAQQRLAGH